jgi:hypothetical protein
MTRVAWHLKADELQKAAPGTTRRRFVYSLSKASYRKEWGKHYEKPGAGTAVLAFFIRILPKVGPLRALAFKPPSAQTERLFEQSFIRTLAEYRPLLAEQGENRLTLDNRDFDTGHPTSPTEYRLADAAYAQLAVKLAEKPPATIDAALRENVITYFHDTTLNFATKKNSKEWQKTLEAVQKLQSGVSTRASSN